MSCMSCFGLHTSPGAAIRCYEAYKTADQYLHSGPPATSQRNQGLTRQVFGTSQSWRPTSEARDEPFRTAGVRPRAEAALASKQESRT